MSRNIKPFTLRLTTLLVIFAFLLAACAAPTQAPPAETQAPPPPTEAPPPTAAPVVTEAMPEVTEVMTEAPVVTEAPAGGTSVKDRSSAPCSLQSRRHGDDHRHAGFLG